MATDVFLSYSSKDREIVQAFEEALRAKGLRTFFDKTNLVPGGLWVEDLAVAIRETRACAIFAAGSTLGRVQLREVQFALIQEAQRARSDSPFTIIPVLLPGASEEVFSGFLELFTWADCRTTAPLESSGFRHILATLLGTEPDEPPRAVDVCPFRGLRPFREFDESWFFGRESFTNRLAGLVNDQPLVAVVGPSGSGKSSVVQAGLIPRLRRMQPPETTWEVLTFTPGHRPFHRLALELTRLWNNDARPESDLVLEAERIGESLAGGTSPCGLIDLAFQRIGDTERLLIVVDQFEELFTLSSNDGESGGDPAASRFIKALLECLTESRLSIVLTLRADFYGRAVALNRQLSDALATGQVVLGPMRDDEIRAAIERPSQMASLRLATGLVERILKDAEGQPGNLPLLEFALTELWQRRKQGALTHEAYAEIDGLAGAMARRAERRLASFSSRERDAARRTLPRLVRVAQGSDEGSDSRQLFELAGLDPVARDVLNGFASDRLVVVGRNELTGDEIAEVAHEALIRDWPTLRAWVEEDRRFLLWRQRLVLSIADWEASNRERSLLLRGLPLREARQWLSEHSAALDGREKAFVKASIAADATTRHMKAAVLVVAVALILVSAGLGVYWRTDYYQVRWAVANAPVEEALSTIRNWDELSSSAFEEWGRLSVRMGRASALYELHTPNTINDDVACMLLAAADELQRMGNTADADALFQRVATSLQGSLGGAILCQARVAFTDAHRNAVLKRVPQYFTTDWSNPAYNRHSRLVGKLALQAVGAPVSDLVSTAQEFLADASYDRLHPLVDALVDAGHADTVMAAIQRRESEELLKLQGTPNPQVSTDLHFLRSQYIDALLRHGHLEKAQELLARKQGFNAGSSQFAPMHVLAMLIRAGRIYDADRSLIEFHRIYGVSNPYFSESYAFIAAAYADVGANGSAGYYLQLAKDSAKRARGDESTSRAFAAIADAAARMGNLHDARQYADRCRRSFPKVQACVSILRSAVR